MVKNTRNSNAFKNNQKNSSSKIKKRKTRKMPTKVKKNVLNFINSETENITEGENHFGFESSTEETTKISLDDGLTINNLSLSYINGFSEESINTDEKINNFNIDNYKLETKIANCGRCSNNCEIVTVYKNDKLIDHWGNRCERGSMLKNV